MEDHRRLGGDLDVDISWKWLNFFLDDDEALAKIGKEYSSGNMLSGEIKQELIKCLTPMIAAHQEARARVTDAHVDQFFSTAPREFASMFGELQGPAPEPTPGVTVSFQGSETLVATGAPSGGGAAGGKTKKGDGGDPAAAGAGADGQPLSKNALKKLAKEKEIAEKKAKKAAEAAAKAAAAAAQ